MNKDLKGKYALVSGGSKGIGFASAVNLANQGAHITLMSRQEEDLKKAVAQLPKIYPDQIHDYIAVDVTNLDELKNKVDKANKPFSILINNSGGPNAGPIVGAPISEFESAFRQHVLVNQTLAMLCIEYMKQVGYGRIINIISTSVKQPLPNLGVSNTIRAAVANWSKTLSNEIAPLGFTVNNVLPGATETDRLKSILKNRAEKQHTTTEEIAQHMEEEIPMKRFGKPEEIAAAVGFLASPSSSYITGINIPVDGGRTSSL